jgi:hypothetical protein
MQVIAQNKDYAKVVAMPYFNSSPHFINTLQLNICHQAILRPEKPHFMDFGVKCYQSIVYMIPSVNMVAFNTQKCHF